MTKTETSKIIKGPVAPRFGSLVPRAVYDFYREGETRLDLTKEQRQEVISYENSLGDTVVDEHQGITVAGALERGSIDSDATFVSDEQQAPVLFISYLRSQEFRDDLSSDGFQELNIPESQAGPDNLVHLLSELSFDPANKKRLLKLCIKSQQFAVKQFTDGASESIDEHQLFNVDPVGCVRQFQIFVEISRLLYQERQRIISQLQEMAGDGSDSYELLYSQLMIADIYMGKIKTVIANYIPRIIQVVKQGQGLDRNAVSVVKEAQSFIPDGILQYIDDPSYLSDYYKKLDQITNGAYQGEPVDRTIFVGNQTDTDNLSSEPDPLLNNEEARVLASVTVKEDDIPLIMQSVLDTIGLNGWHALKNPGKSTFQVMGSNKEFYTPHRDMSIKGMLTIGCHEFMHIIQTINDMSSELRITHAQGRRSGGIREAYGKKEERMVLGLLFGETQEPAATYANAIDVLWEGGKPSDAAEAFLKAQKKADRSVAADRIIRLLRLGASSQPMVYAESSRIEHTISDIQMYYPELDGSNSGLDLPDQIRLARIGLLEKGSSGVQTLDVLAALVSVLSEDPNYSDIIDWATLKSKIENLRQGNI